ncbi:MAG: S8 family serine peptidase [Steroidobacteraceae bacterium]
MLGRILSCSLLAAQLVSAARASAVELNDLGARRSPEAEAAPGRLLVRFQPSSVAAAAKAAADPVAALARRSGIALSGLKDLGAGIHLLAVPQSPGALPSLAEQLRRDPQVAQVALDRRRFAHRLPNDPLFNGQWYLQSAQAAAIRAEQVWDTTTGSSGIVVADLDTGVRFEHPDLGRAAQGGKLLPGYDFVSADTNGGFLVANDGSGWDPDPTDPGDWINAQDAAKAQFKGCTVADSSWHGTRTAGMIAAAGNNGAGIAGGSWTTWLLPVRVLGKCGGFDSDIIAAMRWAAGLHVVGVPDNPYPARILNMSLGNTDTTQCQIYQPVVNELLTHGVLVVASAGNEGGPVDEPANCRGVLAVAGLRHAGTKVGYSNLGPQIGISAPAGNCVNASGGPCLYSLDTTTDRGLTSAAGATYTDQINSNLGTSFSAPQASAVAALMLAVDGRLDAALLIARMQRGARTFPTPSVGDAGQPLPGCHVPAGATDVQSTECVCNTRVCGAGVLNAAGSVQEALKPIASIQAMAASPRAQP